MCEGLPPEVRAIASKRTESNEPIDESCLLRCYDRRPSYKIISLLAGTPCTIRKFKLPGERGIFNWKAKGAREMLLGRDYATVTEDTQKLRQWALMYHKAT